MSTDKDKIGYPVAEHLENYDTRFFHASGRRYRSWYSSFFYSHWHFLPPAIHADYARLSHQIDQAEVTEQVHAVTLRRFENRLDATRV